MEALRHAILPKSYLKDRYPRIEGSWPCYGIPEKLVCDRGSDLISKDLEHAAFQLGIELDFNPPRMPHFKGTVESFFDVLNDQLLASLPGRTFRSWQSRADYQPDDGPLISYEGLLEVIHIHLTDVHAVSKHPAATKTRLDMWRESAAEHPPCLPPSPDDLVVLLAKHVERTLSTRGLELNGMFYNSDELMALRAELASNNIRTNRLQVRYNPWDLGHVWIRNPVDDRYLKARAADDVMQGMTEYQWKVLRRAVRERFDRPEHLLNLAAGRNAIRDVVEATLSKPSRKRRVRAARFGQTQPAADPQLQEGEWIDVADPEAQTPIVVGPSDDPPATRDDPDRAEPPADDEKREASPDELDPADIDVDDIDPADIDVDDWDVACGQ
jgi:putative transposase